MSGRDSNPGIQHCELDKLYLKKVTARAKAKTSGERRNKKVTET